MNNKDKDLANLSNKHGLLGVYCAWDYDYNDYAVILRGEHNCELELNHRVKGRLVFADGTTILAGLDGMGIWRLTVETVGVGAKVIVAPAVKTDNIDTESERIIIQRADRRLWEDFTITRDVIDV